MARDPTDDRPFAERGRGGSELIVFGRRGVHEALVTRDVEVMSVHLSRKLPRDLRSEFVESARGANAAVETVSAGAVSALTGEPRHDQGVAARIRLLRLMDVEGFIESRKGAQARRPSRVLALDGITNSQNVGMIVRSAVATGMDALLWPTVGTPWINGLVVKSSAGTVLRCPILRCEELIHGLLALQGAGFELVGLAGDAPDALADLDPPHRAVYVVGSETAGLSDDVRASLDRSVKIPMQGGVESLNVAVAASLVCFHVTRSVGV